jgi:uncharacterized repeat protein (TIGR01451 family)
VANQASLRILTVYALASPAGLAFDAAGSLLIADGAAIRRVSADGVIVTVAGSASVGYAGDGGPATAAKFNYAYGVTVDNHGRVYVVDSGANAIRALTPTAAQPVLTVAKTHSGNFSPGQNGAVYTVTVANAATAGPSAGLVTVTDVIPAGLTLVSMSGTGWVCVANSCTRSDALAGGAAYPPIAVTVNVAANAPSQLINQVTVTGGGSVAGIRISDLGVIPAALTVAKTHVGNFVSGQSGATYTVTVGNGANGGPTSAFVAVTENVPSGMTLVSMAGTGWTCAANTCTRGDTLAIGASYPPITVTVNVAANVNTPLVNSVSVSGGGSAGAGTTDSATITCG